MEQPPTNDPAEAWRQAEPARASFAWFGEAHGPAPPAESASEQRQRRQADLGRFVASSLRRAEATAVEQPAAKRRTGDIAADTNGELVPRYEYIERRADHLVFGDLLVEPHLGEVRITWVADVGYDVTRQANLVRLHWSDDHGLSAAARTLPARERVTLRVPDQVDELAVRRAIDRARYHRVDLDDRNARLIAAHLQQGPGTGLYRLAVTGEIQPSALEELESIATSGRRYLRQWSSALRSYCEHRPDKGPIFDDEARSW
jgi:hypothetical protein